MPVVRVLLAVPLALAVAACGSSSGPDAARPAEPDHLVVVQDAGPGTASVRHTLRCEPAGGDHPRAAQACQQLSAAADPFRPLPTAQACSQIYGGPDRATVTGTWHGRAVDLQLSRVDGCHAGQWEQLGALLDRPVGATPPP